MPSLGMFRSNGTGLEIVARYDGDVPGWGGLARNDQLHVGDFDGDGKADLYIFNGPDWSMPYLGMFRSNGRGLELVARYDGDVPGWGGMRSNDIFLSVDINGDKKSDLFVYNFKDWPFEYVGKMISDGSSLSCSYAEDWIGEWNLGSVDMFETGNFQGGLGKPDLLVHNHDWFGVIQCNDGFWLQQIYYRWIHNYNYGRNW